MYVHLRFIANKLKKISKCRLCPPPWKNFCGRPCLEPYLGAKPTKAPRWRRDWLESWAIGRFFPGATTGDFSKIFPGGAKSGEICFLPIETEKTTLFFWNFQNPGGAKAPLPPPFRYPWLEYLYQPQYVNRSEEKWAVFYNWYHFMSKCFRAAVGQRLRITFVIRLRRVC